MPGKGLYLVGKDHAYAQVQDAINALQEDQGSTPFTADQEIRIAQSGSYKGFQVLRTIIPSSSYRLTIAAAPGVEAVISGKISDWNTGVFIHRGVENVTIKGLYVQDFTAGIYFDLWCYGAIVDSCRTHRIDHYGIWMAQCNEVQVANNEVVGGRGIGLLACSGAVVAHNSIFSQSMMGIYFSLSPLYSPDECRIYNNAIYAEDWSALTLWERDLKSLLADYNNYYVPGIEVARVCYGKTDDWETNYTAYQDLTKWRQVSGQDNHSISVPPGWERHQPDEEGASLSLKPVQTSSLIGAGFDMTSGSYLPGWADSTLFVTDIAGQTRSTTPTIGAYEWAKDDEDNDDPVIQVTDTDETGLDCGLRVSIIDRAVLQLRKQVPCWHPEVHRGFFFVRDMPYYLYANKEGLTLGDVSVDEFELDVDMLETGLDVAVGTAAIPSSNWELHGPVLRVYHRGLDLDRLGDSVVITGNYLDWDSGTDSFHDKSIRFEFQLNQGRRRYILPQVPLDSAPIVITDDTVNPMNTLSPGQFKVSDPVGQWGPEIELLSPNLLDNSAFHYQTSDLPDDWEYDDSLTGLTLLTSTDVSGETDLHPYHGDRFVFLESDQHVSQALPVYSDRSYVLSYHVAVPPETTGEVVTSFVEYDALKREISTAGGTLDSGTPTSSSWTRREVALPTLDTDTAFIEVQLQGGSIYLDAVQVEIGSTATNYAHVPRSADMTVEYETSDRLFYKVFDLDISAFRNRMHQGFLHIPAVSAKQFDVDAPADATTISDWRWAYGRTDVLPWAKTDGINKWRRVRGWDHDDTLAFEEEAAFGLPVAGPKTVLIEPAAPVIRQSSRGVEFAAEVRSSTNNPYAFEKITLSISEDHGKEPGYLAQRSYGYFTHLGQQIKPESNNRGEVAGRYVPPWAEDVQVEIDSVTGAEGLRWVDVPYEVSKANHGNPTLHDRYGTLIPLVPLTGEKILQSYPEGEYSIFDMGTEYPYFGSMVVQEADDTGWGYPLGETRNSLMAETQFFMNYETNRLTLLGTSRGPVRAQFDKRRIWTRAEYKRRLFMDNDAADMVTGENLLRYDANIKLTVRADKPDGLTRGGSVHRTADVIVQNPSRGEIR